MDDLSSRVAFFVLKNIPTLLVGMYFSISPFFDHGSYGSLVGIFFLIMIGMIGRDVLFHHAMNDLSSCPLKILSIGRDDTSFFLLRSTICAGESLSEFFAGPPATQVFISFFFGHGSMDDCLLST